MVLILDCTPLNLANLEGYTGIVKLYDFLIQKNA